MAKTNQTDPRDTLDFLAAFIGDPKGYKAKYEELKSLEASTTALIELVGPTNEIISLRDETKDINAKSKQASKDAKVKAESLLLDASNKALEITGDADSHRYSILRDLKDKEDSLIQQAKELEKQTQALADATSKLETEKTKLAKDKAAFEAIQQKNYDAYVKSKDAFDAARGEILQKHEQFIDSLRRVSVDES